MDIFKSGDRVVAINTDLRWPIRGVKNSHIENYDFPDGAPQKGQVYHVSDARPLSDGSQALIITGLRVTHLGDEMPWNSTRFRKVDLKRDCKEKKWRHEQPKGMPIKTGLAKQSRRTVRVIG